MCKWILPHCSHERRHPTPQPSFVLCAQLMICWFSSCFPYVVPSACCCRDQSSLLASCENLAPIFRLATAEGEIRGVKNLFTGGPSAASFMLNIAAPLSLSLSPAPRAEASEDARWQKMLVSRRVTQKRGRGRPAEVSSPEDGMRWTDSTQHSLTLSAAAWIVAGGGPRVKENGKLCR